ncbi:hypothetical protein RO21_11715, partial [[Actinobacillus] muris]
IFKVGALAQENLNDVMQVGLYRQSLNRNATTANNYPVNQAGTLRVEPSAYEVQQTYTTFQSNQIYVRGRGSEGWNEWRRVDGVNCLKLTGGTLTGALEIDAAESFVRGKRNGANNWFIGTANGTSNDIVLRSYGHNTHISLQADKVYTNKDIYVGENKVNHWGDSYLKATANNYGGIMIDRPTRNDRMLIESHDNRFALIRRNTESGANHYVITTPEKSGVTALVEDFTYQKTGNFEIRRYPDGTMIQTYFIEQNDIVPQGKDSGIKRFNWAVAFTQTPMVFAQIDYKSINSDWSGVVSVYKWQSNGAQCVYQLKEFWANHQGDMAIQFLAIGRWK